MDYMKESLAKHREWKGKLEVVSRAPVGCAEELSLAYTPGVAAPCLAIKDDPLEAYALTRKWNTVAVVTDGSAVLGLGNIGALAGMPVMEGKCALFKAFAGVDAVPVCLATQDTEEIIATVRNIAPSYGGINLEDISAPRCFEIERRLKAELDIPVFHDDQHGTAVVLSAALINALKVVKKDISTARIVINGAGSAGVAIAEFLLLSGAGDLVVCDKAGVIGDSDEFNPVQRELSRRTNPRGVKGKLSDAVAGADVFIGVSVAGALSEADVRSMAKDIIKSGEWREFLAARPVRLYEHAMLLGVVSASVKEPYEDKIERLERFSRLVDDWAVCDITCSSLRCKDERLFGDMARFAGSGNVWLARIGLVVLLGNYADGEHVDGLREVINGVRAQGYYVDMAVGWLIATVESHTEGGGLELMRTARLSPEIKKIAAAKMRDSFRVSEESKREASRIAKG